MEGKIKMKISYFIKRKKGDQIETSNLINTEEAENIGPTKPNNKKNTN